MRKITNAQNMNSEEKVQTERKAELQKNNIYYY